MDPQMLSTLLTFLGGLAGGSGIASAWFAHRLRRREAAHTARVSRVVERKADLYRRCAAFLRGLRSYGMQQWTDEWNALADEMILWASTDVYRTFAAAAREMAANPSGDGTDWLDIVFPTLKAMTKDINPDNDLRREDVLPHLTFVDVSSVGGLWRAAWEAPAEFNEIAKLTKENAELIGEILRHRHGDYDSVCAAILARLRHADDEEASINRDGHTVGDEMTAVLKSFVIHPSKDRALAIGQISEFVGIDGSRAQEYLSVLVTADLVTIGHDAKGRALYSLTERGRSVLTESADNSEAQTYIT